MRQKFLKHISFLSLIIIYLLIFPNPSLAASLKFEPANNTKSVGEQGEIKVILDTEGADVYGVEAYISIEGSSANFESLNVAGSVSQDELIDSSISTNQIYFAILKPDSVINGVEPIATIKYTAKSPGDTLLSFITEGTSNVTEVAEVDNPDNVLTSAGTATISVSGDIEAGTANESSDFTSTQNENPSNLPSTDSGFIDVGSTTNNSVPSNNSEVPSTGYTNYFLYIVLSASFFASSLGVKKLVQKAYI